MTKFLDKLSIPQIIMIAYVSVITIGTILLTLPFASATGEWTSIVDSLFTATSATAVTGQITLDTATYWNYFGKTVILVLIEIGGLGFMTFWIIFYYFIRGHGPNLKQRMIVSESLSIEAEDSLPKRIFSIIRLSLIIQLIGAIILGTVFLPEFGVGEGIYYSIFHSISAFCNAGFALFSDSLIGFQSNPVLLITVSLLVIAGGLGFIVWDDLLRFRQTRKLQRYTKIVLTTTAILGLGSFILFWILEGRNGSFSHLPFGERLLNYFFLAVTPRTAGFANVDYTLVSSGSLFLTIMLMFIGASSGSTGGGIKVSTFAVIILTVYRSLQNKQTMIFNRRISRNTVRRSFFIFTAGILIAGVSIFILSVTETVPERFGIEFILVEVFSGLGTVGLSMGLTPSLTVIGKFVMIALMLIGRVGVMTFLFSIVGENPKSRINYPEMDVLVG